MTDTLHSQFKQWLLDAHRNGEIGPRAYRLGDIVLRYLAVIEELGDFHNPQTREAAEEAVREFQEALKDRERHR